MPADFHYKLKSQLIERHKLSTRSKELQAIDSTIIHEW